jgi:hypothetical protein
MAPGRGRRVLVLAAFVASVFLGLSTRSGIGPSGTVAGGGVNVLNRPAQFPPLDGPGPRCVRTKRLMGGRAHKSEFDHLIEFLVAPLICVKPEQEDQYISKALRQKGMWEEGIVTSVLKVAVEYPDAVFLDLGSNLGVYSIMVAALRRLGTVSHEQLLHCTGWDIRQEVYFSSLWLL